MCCAVRKISPAFVEKAVPTIVGILMVLFLILVCFLFSTASGAVTKPLDAPFSGAGRMERFGISGSGEIVIFVSEELSHDRYIMCLTPAAA